MKFQHATGITAAALILCGCVSSGTKVTAEQASQFVKGTTTETQVIAKLGEPNSRSAASDGTLTFVYFYVRASADAATYVPIVGAFAGGARGSSNMATFIFGPDKILKDYSTTVTDTRFKNGGF